MGETYSAPEKLRIITIPDLILQALSWSCRQRFKKHHNLQDLREGWSGAKGRWR